MTRSHLRCVFRQDADLHDRLEISLDDRPLSSFARAALCHLPTPLEPLHRLSAHLGGNRSLYVKRDDCTGLAGGGNKSRKLELVMADALQQQADVVITHGALQSNHARQTAAAAARLGIGCRLILEQRLDNPGEVYTSSGNLLMGRILGAPIEAVVKGTDCLKIAQMALQRELKNGRKAYLIAGGASTPLGAIGYIACASELEAQARDRNLSIDAIVCCAGSGGTLAGLAAGTAYWERPPYLFGVSSGSHNAVSAAAVLALAARTADLVGLDSSVVRARSRIEVLYPSADYGVVDPSVLEAIDVTARTEGLLLDPVYTGRAMASLLAQATVGALGKAKTIVFLHTGGIPGLFAYGTALLQSDKENGETIGRARTSGIHA
ncbi:D-cysteine desulfhydrase family protein [Bradyrhizobium sp. Gha]|uniref:D-cysteine desulfhydrase family protein n=1 Tax=Bradyrhizobium sp. Gha TaxID=1855318 RepID=UPI0008EB5669|nr:D-cysteine desulfhydrase family protein [Bradyrhizobium sp. Gha]SFK16605.1 D-cysteine desulfhydrase [Bradyrhizobium sp. Gha]